MNRLKLHRYLGQKGFTLNHDKSLQIFSYWGQKTHFPKDVKSIEESLSKTYLYNFDPLKPHFNIVKLRFTGVYIIFLISAQKHRLWVFVRTAWVREF